MDNDGGGGRQAGNTEQTWGRAVPGGTGITVLAIHFSHHVDDDTLRSALHELHRSRPLLRAKLTLPNGPGQPFSFLIHPDPDIQILSFDDSATSELVSLATGDGPSPISPLQAVLEHEMNQNPWEVPSPSTDVFFASVYEVPDEDSSILALRVHTSVVDRTAGIAVVRELLGLIGKLERDSEAADGSEVREVLPAIEDLVPQERSQKPFWARGRDMLGYSLNFTRSSLLPFVDAGSKRSSKLVRFELSEEETESLLFACREREIKLCGALTAAGMIATVTHKHLPDNKSETYSIITLIDCRKDLTRVLNDSDIGFYHSAIQNAHTVHAEEGLWEVATRCHSSFSTAMTNDKHFTDMGDLNFLMLKSIQNPYLTPSSSMRTALISVFAEPMSYGTEEVYQGVGVLDYMAGASVHGVGPSFGIFDTVRDGKLCCSLLYPSPLHSREQMQQLAVDMKRILVEATGADGGGA